MLPAMRPNFLTQGLSTRTQRFASRISRCTAISASMAGITSSTFPGLRSGNKQIPEAQYPPLYVHDAVCEPVIAECWECRAGGQTSEAMEGLKSSGSSYMKPRFYYVMVVVGTLTISQLSYASSPV